MTNCLCFRAFMKSQTRVINTPVIISMHLYQFLQTTLLSGRHLGISAHPKQ